MHKMHPADMPPSSNEHHPHPPKCRKKRRGGRALSFFKGYLMIVGALTTLYVLTQLLVLLLIEASKWGM